MKFILSFLRTTFITKQTANFLDKPLNPSRKAVYLVSLAHVWWANQKNKFIHKACKEVMKTDIIVLYFPTNFYLAEAINKKLGVFISSGIKQYWFNEFIYKHAGSNEDDKTGPKQLTIRHLIGVFNVYLIACTSSFVVFLLEHFHIRVRTRFRNFRNIWIGCVHNK